jgi:hypothetical protein
MMTVCHFNQADVAARYAAKWRLAKLLYERDWDKQRILDLFAVIDWLMRLPPELEKQLWTEITELERNVKMRYVLSVERLAMEQGIERGRQEGEITLLRRLLARRFGSLPESIETRLTSASIEQLENWEERILDVDTLEDVFR